jgi:hypothetical protein
VTTPNQNSAERPTLGHRTTKAAPGTRGNTTTNAGLIEIQIQYRAVADLVLDPRNPRQHSQNQVNQIADSIREFGFVMPIVVDHTGQVVIGHGRVLAARKLGIRAEDCASAANANVEFLDNPPSPKNAIKDRRNALEKLQNAVETVDQKAKAGIEYDSATHDIFPFFKRDFRPIADRLEAYGRWLDNPAPQPSCIYSKRLPPQTTVARWIVSFADFLRDAPFQNTDMEDTRTIGNLDVPRHSAGTLDDYLPSARPFGTTHEIRGTRSKLEAPVDYAAIPTSEIAKCPVSHNWLTRARKATTNGINWDSNRLYPADTQSSKKSESTISARITHGFYLAGIQPITRANDPFWNMRAYDDVLAEHSGYKLSSFICAINQIVMDRTTSLPASLNQIPKVPDQPKNPAEIVPQ